ncbi:MAG: hypothetical protein AAGH46_05540 [Bacteroidota bacterium]
MTTNDFNFKTPIKLILIILLTVNFNCGPVDMIPPQRDLENYYSADQIAVFEECDSLINSYYDRIYSESLPILNGTSYADNIVRGSAGFSLNSVSETSQTSIAFGAEYARRITKDNPNDAFYLGPKVNLTIRSEDEFDSTMYQAGLQALYFNNLTRLGELDWTLGLNAYYEGGSVENFNVEETVSGFGAALAAGCNDNLSDSWTIGVNTTVFRYINRTFELDGSEFDQSGVLLGLNQDNLAMAYLQFNF